MKTNNIIVMNMLKIKLILILLLFITIPAFAQDDSIGIVSSLQGEVVVVRNDSDLKVFQGMKVYLGDYFETGDDSGVKIVFIDDTLITLSDNTDLEITEFIYNPEERKTVSNITKGKMRAFVQKFKGESSVVEYRTENAVAGVKGTSLFIDVLNNIISVIEGEIYVRSLVDETKEIILQAGQYTHIGPDGIPSAPAFNSQGILNDYHDTNFPDSIYDAIDPYGVYYPGGNIPPDSKTTPTTPTPNNNNNNPPTQPPIDLSPGDTTNGGQILVPVQIDIPGT